MLLNSTHVATAWKIVFAVGVHDFRSISLGFQKTFPKGQLPLDKQPAGSLNPAQNRLFLNLRNDRRSIPLFRQ
jgi:hypothetical protein